MTGFTTLNVEDWLDTNRDALCEIFLRKADIVLINKWLLLHGYNAVCETAPYPTKRGSLSSTENSSPSSPLDKCQETFFDTRNQRQNSKKFLRQEFSKSRMKNMFRTYEPVTSSESAVESRRSSLKDMRMFRSLPPNSVNILSLLIQSKVRLPRYPSKDKAKKLDLKHMSEREFFLDIVKDISNDLDLRSLTNKMIANIGLLVDADEASVYVVEGRTTNRPVLVSKQFDVHTGTCSYPSPTEDDSVHVTWGRGIIGQVAAKGECINLQDAASDPRYNDDVDRVLGFRARSLLCMPILNGDEEVVGVAQVINKVDAEEGFTRDDEKILATYLTFCGIAISNAQIFEAYSKEYERNKALLEVVHDLFEEQTSLENVIVKIMQRAQTLLKCERCSVLLKDTATESSFKKIFELDMQLKNENSFARSSSNGRQKSFCHIAEVVVLTGETVNISDIDHDSRFSLEDNENHHHVKSIMCKPIRNRQSQIIGVAQVINKLDGLPFDDHDDQLFEAFAIFCGLGINNCVLYEEISLMAAKQAVTLEVLSYHAGVSDFEVTALQCQTLPSTKELKLDQLDFNDYSLSKDEMLLASIRIFKDLGLVRRFKIDYKVLCRWILTVRKNYRDVSYHNWGHAFNVCQMMFALLKESSLRKFMSDEERLSVIVGCLCHDLDHRGTNNAFQIKSGSPLLQLYGTSGTLEHHHFSHAVTILSSQGTNIFANFSSNEYSEIINLMKQAILATDLSKHLQVRSKFFAMADSGQKAWDDKESKEILRNVLMTACDIATITKPWEIQRKAADLVMSEFLAQGDKEREELNIKPQACMDRERQNELPKLQLGWIDGICLPLYKSLAKTDERLSCLLAGVIHNRDEWETLDLQRTSAVNL